MKKRILIPLSTLLLLLSFSSAALAQEQVGSSRKVLTTAKPVYPELARKMQIYGTVKIQATVSPDGKLSSSHVMGGSPLLVQAAVDAIKNWQWAPQSSESTELVEVTFHK